MRKCRLFLLELALLATISSLLTGCATSFHRENAMARLSDLKPDRSGVVNVEFETPLKLAVYMDMETINSDGAFFDKWQWNHEDELILIPYFDRLVKKRIFSDYFFLPENGFDPVDIDGVFKQAEKDGAEAILSIRSISFVDWYYNPAGILDLTLIGTFWIPGSNRDALILIRGDYWDVKNRRLVFSTWSEGLSRTVGPTFIISSENAFKEAKRKSLINFMKELNQEVHPGFDVNLIK